jgi:hypothetical protein
MKVRCVECEQAFEIEPDEVDWYKKRGLCVPKRCKTCREKIKHIEYVPCKDCGEIFTMNELQAEHFLKKGLQVPKRCPECRKAIKGRQKNE